MDGLFLVISCPLLTFLTFYLLLPPVGEVQRFIIVCFLRFYVRPCFGGGGVVNQREFTSYPCTFQRFLFFSVLLCSSPFELVRHFPRVFCDANRFSCPDFLPSRVPPFLCVWRTSFFLPWKISRPVVFLILNALYTPFCTPVTPVLLLFFFVTSMSLCLRITWSADVSFCP